MKSANWPTHTALLLVSTLYGINYSIVKIVTPAFIAPLGFIGYRVLFAAAIFWLITKNSTESIDWKNDGFRLFLCGATGAGINMLLFFKGVSMTTAVNASLIMTLLPLFVFILSIIILKEKVIIWRLVGLIVGLLGAGLVVYQPNQLSSSNPIGDLMIVGNAFSYSLYLVLVKRLMTRYQPLTIAKWIFIFGLLFCLPFCFDQAIDIEPATFTWQVWLSIIYVILGVTVVVYFLNIWAMRRSSPTLVSAYAYLQPVVAISVAVLFFGEQLNWTHILGGSLIFLGIYLVSRYRTTAIKA
jgi:drug/metabolite transporter (DMT)-like permease